MEPWRAVDAHSGGVEDQNGALEGLFCIPIVANLNHFNEVQVPDPEADPH